MYVCVCIVYGVCTVYGVCIRMDGYSDVCTYRWIFECMHVWMF